MNTIRIQNLRNLVDTGDIKLAPLTILLGQNSSGKSSFLRTFPLLKQSAVTDTQGPILWVGNENGYVDFGSFDEAVNVQSETISFTFTKHVTDRIPTFVNSKIINDPAKYPLLYFNDTVEYTIDIQNSKNTYISKASVKTRDVSGKTISIEVYYNDEGKMTSISLCDKEQREYTDVDIDSDIFDNPLNDRNLSKSFGFRLPENTFILKELNYKADPDILFSYLVLQGSASWKSMNEEAYDHNVKLIDKYREKRLVPYYPDSFHDNPIPNDQLIKAGRIAYLLSLFWQVDRLIYASIVNVHYMAPVRATAERFYRVRNYAVKEVDYQGKNLAEYLLNLSTEALKDFHAWTLQHFGLEFSVMADHGILRLMVRNDDEENMLNVCDVGFGISQVLPILVELWSLAYSGKKATFVIEQPELHLHPTMQGRLMRAIASVIVQDENHLSVIIETHSKTMVEALGAMIYHKQLKKDDVNVVLFKKKNSRRAEVTQTGFDDYGYLDHWQFGFLDDEA